MTGKMTGNREDDRERVPADDGRGTAERLLTLAN